MGSPRAVIMGRQLQQPQQQQQQLANKPALAGCSRALGLRSRPGLPKPSSFCKPAQPKLWGSRRQLRPEAWSWTELVAGHPAPGICSRSRPWHCRPMSGTAGIGRSTDSWPDSAQLGEGKGVLPPPRRHSGGQLSSTSRKHVSGLVPVRERGSARPLRTIMRSLEGWVPSHRHPNH